MAEFHTLRLAAVFAANPELDVGTRFAAQVARDFHQPTNTFLVDRGKGIVRHNVQLRVVREEAAGVVATHSKCGLSEIVRSKAKKLCVLCDLIRDERGARDL